MAEQQNIAELLARFQQASVELHTGLAQQAAWQQPAAHNHAILTALLQVGRNVFDVSTRERETGAEEAFMRYRYTISSLSLLLCTCSRAVVAINILTRQHNAHHTRSLRPLMNPTTGNIPPNQPLRDQELARMTGAPLCRCPLRPV